ncbi:LysM peptidoglycan-binding domain-containing protein [Hymenobacter sp. RP-2-7]|uniref:LysM peptidoglycan-binding domain-containing protein n=1 Tax=Hymenobacter polaris TaxID=2682546 RepID=A0A7Y0ACU2_9BACT|nr:LysM peptidoglycan-binding domain-containing protein [Hymenobacter polaris]NML65006.1 LysM peptidoglycan-binding domain-containing protein [Hymenobacter polaris]
MNALHGPLPRLVPPAPPADSIGQEMRGGQRLVRYRVAQGENLFRLTKKYKVSTEQLLAYNPQLKNGLGIGQIVLIPRPGQGAARAAAPNSATPAASPLPAVAAAAGSAPARYTVGRGETLFSIARRFGLSPAGLIELNHLPSTGSVRAGQELLLRAAEAGAPAAVPVRATLPLPVATAPTTPLRLDPDKEAEVATVTPAAPAAVAPAPEKEKVVTRERDREETPRSPTRASELAGRRTEPGVAAVIDNSGTDKYLALHKTAPVGTIMEVKNMLNGQTVYVRVIGQLPDTGENDNILVRLSPRAVAKLGTTDAKFRVETSYVP